MGIEYYFLFACMGALVLITLGLVFNTCISGKKYFRTFQFLMSAMPYSTDAEKTITLLLNKLEANLLVAKIQGDYIVFYEEENEHGVTYSTSYSEIFIGSKYYAYGYLNRYYGNRDQEFYRKRPKIKTLKRIVKLEESLRQDTSTNAAPPKDKRNKESKVVELS